MAAIVEAHSDKHGRADRAAAAHAILARGAFVIRHWFGREWLFEGGAYEPDEPYEIAAILYPWGADQTHAMLLGTSGTGKSTAMKDLLRQIRERGDHAGVFDLTGTFAERYYVPNRDTILNPCDSHCPAWPPSSDASTREHLKEASLALIPMSDKGGEQFWPESVRLLFVEACLKLRERGWTTKHLSDVPMTSDPTHLHAHLLNTVAGPLADPEARGVAGSIRATYNTYAQALIALPLEGPDFSIREWIKGINAKTAPPGSCAVAFIFVGAQHANLRSIRVLLTKRSFRRKPSASEINQIAKRTVLTDVSSLALKWYQDTSVGTGR